MRIGAVFPQTEIGADVGALRAWGTGVEELGFDHVLAYDHVLGADPMVHAPWKGHYDVDDTFHEPLVLFGFLAAIARIELATCVLVLPQRQTALVAKQAAEVDLLAEGCFRLGVGIGWNAVEYDALGKSFQDRGRRLDEQIALLRSLWSERSIVFDGVHEQVRGAGIVPLPVQRPIPVWLGGRSSAAYARIGRLADGWFPQLQPGPALDDAVRAIERAAAEAGRDARDILMEGRLTWDDSGPAGVVRQVDEWAAAGASHASVNTMGAGLGGVDGHLAALEHAARALGLPA